MFPYILLINLFITASLIQASSSSDRSSSPMQVTVQQHDSEQSDGEDEELAALAGTKKSFSIGRSKSGRASSMMKGDRTTSLTRLVQSAQLWSLTSEESNPSVSPGKRSSDQTTQSSPEKRTVSAVSLAQSPATPALSVGRASSHLQSETPTSPYTHS